MQHTVNKHVYILQLGAIRRPEQLVKVEWCKCSISPCFLGLLCLKYNMAKTESRAMHADQQDRIYFRTPFLANRKLREKEGASIIASNVDTSAVSESVFLPMGSSDNIEEIVTPISKVTSFAFPLGKVYWIPPESNVFMRH